MKILGIDTSCDETSIAILEIKKEKIKVLANVISSQVKIHQKYGGVFPSLAKREHQKNLIIIFKEALKNANLLKRKTFKLNFKNIENILKRDEELLINFKEFFKKYGFSRIDLISITQGPGLEPCLFVGINFAKALSLVSKTKILPINHIKAHLFSSFLSFDKIPKILFPALGLIVSGGHTQLLLLKSFKNIKTIGQTKDDAAGECLDKTARILGLPYPGGPQIEKLALNCKSNFFNIKLPRPMIYQKNYDFSFSGLKTAVYYDFSKRPKEIRNSLKYKQEMAKEIQEAVFDSLLIKTKRAILDLNIKTLLTGGGVFSNKLLREKITLLSKELNVDLFLPEREYCTDNGAMVALTGYLEINFMNFKKYGKITAKPNLNI
ncbi:MAG: tRNA (adenosine(37)-N6)-threonylcarbamoyltransferase complex transferase subunit TsaD [Minisyncoccia bacterium]